MASAEPTRLPTTVLVVEDSPEIQRYLRVLLEMDHYQVETASNGEEALQRMREGCAPGLVLLDMQMPGMDGLQTLQSLKELWPSLQVIMCSAEEDPTRIQQAILLGAQAYLVKPVQHLYLSAAVARCLSQGQHAGSPTRGRVVTLPLRRCEPAN
jgi:CheY-like chemotaxis protein